MRDSEMKVNVICWAIFLICSTMLLPIVSAGNDDTNEKEVSVWWIKNYPPEYEPDLPNAKYNSEGFYNGMNSWGGWTKRLNLGDGDAWEKHFEKASVGGWDDDYVDAVDFAWFYGHGYTQYLLFEDDHDGDGVYAEQCRNEEASWGDKDLEWIVCCSCYTLQESGVKSRWGEEVFHGLHIMLGFDNSPKDKPYWVIWPIYKRPAGNVFAQMMIDDEYPIVYAWEQMTKNWQPSTKYAAYLSTSLNQYDFLPGIRLGPEEDVDDPEYFEYSKWQC